ncbi:MAG TPA: 2-succinyl-6-hydroxy-2,4-cyclohexadiene-1-carboxylate synthase [bacterium]|jgi:2-succinyl-6-hydroxy-2,4-cyclohexadiene-1-carboxylate synthase
MTDVAASSIDWHVAWQGDPQLPVLALAHGFAGSLHAWEHLIVDLEQHFHLMLIDLPGHGKTPLPPEPEMNLVRLGTALGQLISTAAEEPVSLCGYSMGGRIALHTALYAPEMVKSLALIGASPGIADAVEREERRKADRELAAMIRTRGIEWFADFWGNLPLFASQKSLAPSVQENLHRSRLHNDPEGLAIALEHFGVGTQEDLHPKLSQLKCPVLLIAGALDKKYCRSNAVFEQSTQGGVHLKRAEIHGVGHAAHVEAPDLVAQELIEFFEVGIIS